MNTPPKTGASFARGKSKQNYSTPGEFVAAVECRFGMLDFDLAADSSNCFTRGYFDEATDSLKQDWTKLTGHLWLNPPFNDIASWAEKCFATLALRPATKISLLVPASVGSVWWSKWVHEKAAVKFLSPRLSFDGKNPYPKDCVLCRYGDYVGYECWRWK